MTSLERFLLSAVDQGIFYQGIFYQGILGVIRVVKPISRASNISKLIKKAVRLRQLSRQEHLQLTSAILSGFDIDPIERSLINRLLDSINMGRVKLVD